MLKTLKVILFCHQECSNYGTFIDSTEANTQPCRWYAVSTRVKQKFIYSILVCCPPTNLNPPGPMKLIMYHKVAWCSSAEYADMSTFFLSSALQSSIRRI